MFDETFEYVKSKLSNGLTILIWHIIDMTRLRNDTFFGFSRNLLFIQCVIYSFCICNVKDDVFATWGQRWRKFGTKLNLTGCNWSGLNAPGAETPVFHPLLVGSLFPFPLSGAIRNGGPQYQYQMLGTFWKKISLTGRKCSSLNAPDIETPVSYSLLGSTPNMDDTEWKLRRLQKEPNWQQIVDGTYWILNRMPPGSCSHTPMFNLPLWNSNLKRGNVIESLSPSSHET